MIIHGIGIDIIEISRISDAHNEFGSAFLNRLFTKDEISYCLSKKNPYPHLSARFAAKEAFIKALSPLKFDGFRLKDIEVVTENNMKKPILSFHGETYENLESGIITDSLLSLSHSRTHAIANVVLVKED